MLRNSPLLKKETENPFILGIMLVAVTAMLAVLLLVFTSTLCLVKQTSMFDTLSDGDYVLLNKLDKKYTAGEIVVFNNALEGEYNLIKRVIAVEGEQLKFLHDNNGIINLYKKTSSDADFVIVDEPYIYEKMTYMGHNLVSDIPLGQVITIEENQLFCMGDNRNNSNDSRSNQIGVVSSDKVIGTLYYKVPKNSFIEKVLLFIYGGAKSTNDAENSILRA